MAIKVQNDPANGERCATKNDLANPGLTCKLCGPCLTVGCMAVCMTINVFFIPQDPMPREDMLSYKYQVAMEGRGATFDALFSKLNSNSVVFVVQTPQGDTPALLHHQWFTPLLQPRVNYINTTLEQLRDDIDWCADHDDECQGIAINALMAMQPLLGDEAVVHYMQLVFEVWLVALCADAQPTHVSTQALVKWSGQAMRASPPTSTNMLHLPAWDHLPVVPRNDSGLLRQLPGMSLPGASHRTRSTPVQDRQTNNKNEPGQIPAFDAVLAGEA